MDEEQGLLGTEQDGSICDSTVSEYKETGSTADDDLPLGEEGWRGTGYTRGERTDKNGDEGYGRNDEYKINDI